MTNRKTDDPDAIEAAAKPITLTEQEKDAISVMMDALGLSEEQVLRQALRIYQGDFLRRRDGETYTWSGDAKRASEFSGSLSDIEALTPPPQQDSGLADELVSKLHHFMGGHEQDCKLLLLKPDMGSVSAINAERERRYNQLLKTIPNILSALRQQPNDLLVEARDALKASRVIVNDATIGLNTKRVDGAECLARIDVTLTKLNEALEVSDDAG